MNKLWTPRFVELHLLILILDLVLVQAQVIIVFSPKVKVELCKYGACVTDIITESKYLYVDLSYSVTHGLKPELMLTKIDVYAE